MDYLQSIPFETYKKIILYLSPNELKSLYITDKYCSTVLNKDNYFYYQYINHYYNPKEYGYSSWIYDTRIDWKSMLRKMLSRKKLLYLNTDISDSFENELGQNIAIHENDSFEDIINRISKIVKKDYSKFHYMGKIYPLKIESISIPGKIGTVICDSNQYFISHSRNIDNLDSKIIIGNFYIDNNKLFDSIDNLNPVTINLVIQY